ncbi:MAG TPA: ABC transporter ATP-binding protein [Blastocatellia bacterium]|nr:ABC transporter ATP-binding protein [Blastocatellia bacterium]
MRLSCEDLTKKYGPVPAVDRLNLSVESGELIVLVGPSGCGKTTTLRMMAGLEEITSGRIVFGDTCVNDVPARHRDVAMVFQTYALYPHMTVRQNVDYPLKIRKLGSQLREQKVKQVTEMLGIGHLLSRQPRQLSGGERQRVALARAIVREPRLCLMDEPLSNLDARLRIEMRGELKRLQRQLGTTTVYVTHDQSEAMTLATRVAVMSEGRLQQFATPLEVYNRPANQFVASFIGSPGMNLIDGRVDQSERRFVADGFSFPLAYELTANLQGTEKITLGIRPEDIRLSPNKTPDGVAARVHVTELLGSETHIFLKIADAPIVVRAGADIEVEMDSPAWLSFEPGKLHFFDGTSGERLS